MNDIPLGWIALAAAILGSGGIGGYLSSRGSRENKLIDQQQEDMATLRETAAKDKAEMQAKFDKLEARLKVVIDYNWRIIAHFADGNPPPPPQPPPEMYV